MLEIFVAQEVGNTVFLAGEIERLDFGAVLLLLDIENRALYRVAVAGQGFLAAQATGATVTITAVAISAAIVAAAVIPAAIVTTAVVTAPVIAAAWVGRIGGIGWVGRISWVCGIGRVSRIGASLALGIGLAGVGLRGRGNVGGWLIRAG